ncbi:MAG TPA: DUF1269 domain-containing protein, partial [Candidatus Sulfotelmatobacter sp.]|nr:DUF1269 domain-containing protein [Candidatus Sulfotelmatobacter sp.]
GVAVVAREEDGRITIKDQIGTEGYQDATGGGLLGLLVGVLGGPLGVLVGGATGLLVGSLFDEDEDDETRSALADISKSIRIGPPGLLAEVSEPAPEAVDAIMAHLNGTVVRRSAADVELEVAAAEDAQRAAKKKARHELREARHKKHTDEVDAKLAELKAKLPGHKQEAGAPFVRWEALWHPTPALRRPPPAEALRRSSNPPNPALSDGIGARSAARSVPS